MATATDTQPTDTVPEPPTDAPAEPTPPTAEPAEPGTGLAPAADTLHDLAHGLDLMPAVAELQGLAALAVTLAAANAIPADLRGRPNDVFLVLLTGRELGLAPTAALRNLYIVNGKVTLPPKVRKAMVTKRGLGRVWPHAGPRRIPTDPGEPERWRLCPCGSDDPDNDAERATWHATRADEDHQVTYTFSFGKADALRASSNPKNDRSDTNNLWHKYEAQGYPQRMVSWRALGYLLDDVFSEVGTGLYAPDEVGAMADEEGNAIIDVTTTDPFPGHAAPRGHNAPPPPPPAMASDDERADLARRIANLPPEAKQALHGLWTNSDGVEPVAALAVLPQRQLARAKAMVRSVEGRAKKGEWGTWAPPADPETGEVPTSAQTPAAAAPPATGTPGQAPAPAHGPHAPAGGEPGPGGCPLWRGCEGGPGHDGPCADAMGLAPAAGEAGAERARR
jgi:hypothetical protein